MTILNLPIKGAICGDILGSCYESAGVKYLDHPLCLRADRFTDDTVCTIAVTDAILNDSRMFLTPVYCGKNCFSGGVPTLGVFVEFWKECRELSIEGAGLPICSIVGNPMTGSHGCKAIAPDGSHVKARLNIRFIELVKIFRYINERYNHLKDVCQAYTLEEAVNRLK